MSAIFEPENTDQIEETASRVHVTPDHKAALNAANSPSATNAFTTTADLLATKYQPASLTVVAGTLASGTVADILDPDGGQMRINETTGGLNIMAEYTGVTSFNTVVSRVQYVGGVGHILQRAIWNWVTVTWDLLAEIIGPQDGLTWMTASITESSSYIGTGADTGKVRVHIEHIAPFNATHYLLVDFAGLVQSAGGAPSSDATKLDHTGGTLTNVKETAYATNAVTTKILSLANGNDQEHTLTGATEFEAPPLPSAGVVESLVLTLNPETFAVTWKSVPTIKWLTSDGAPPTLNTVAGKSNVVTLKSQVSKTRWLGFLAGKET